MRTPVWPRSGELAALPCTWAISCVTGSLHGSLPPIVTVVVAVPVAESSSVAVNVTATSPGAAVTSTASVPPAAPVGVNVTPGGSVAGLVTARDVTVPSASVALTVAEAGVPCGVVSVAGAVTTGGWFVTPHGAAALLSGRARRR